MTREWVATRGCIALWIDTIRCIAKLNSTDNIHWELYTRREFTSSNGWRYMDWEKQDAVYTNIDEAKLVAIALGAMR